MHMETQKVIMEKIESAKNSGIHTVRITGSYEISETILIPSDFCLILEDCHLRMADGVKTQMFRNAGYRPGGRNTPSDADKNIRIIGVGHTVLDGGNYNGLCEGNSEKDGNPHISANNTLLFCNVDHFVIENITIVNQRWWALNFLFCSNGTLRDLTFCADDTWYDSEGNRHRKINWEWGRPYICNADGIDLRVGCHDILIENIKGFTEDDTIALTALDLRLEDLYHVEGAQREIYNISIRNVFASSLCTIVRLLNQGGTKLYNVLIDGVFDSSKDSPHLERGIYAVRIGDVHLYGARHSTEDETYNITVRNVYSRSRIAVNLAGRMKNVTTENICGFDGNQTLIEDLREN